MYECMLGSVSHKHVLISLYHKKDLCTSIKTNQKIICKSHFYQDYIALPRHRISFALTLIQILLKVKVCFMLV